MSKPQSHLARSQAASSLSEKNCSVLTKDGRGSGSYSVEGGGAGGAAAQATLAATASDGVREEEEEEESG
jgi:hypothetical protein